MKYIGYALIMWTGYGLATAALVIAFLVGRGCVVEQIEGRRDTCRAYGDEQFPGAK